MKTFNLHIFGLLMFISISFIACKNKTEQEKPAQEEHSDNHGHEEEVLLSKQQFESLNLKIDTLQQRNMSSYIEVNGQLEVPPQNEATITSVIGANVTAIEVIEGDKVEKGQVVAYLSHPNIIEKQTQYLDAYTNLAFLKKEFERQQKLYDAGVGSGMNFQKAEAKYNAAKGLANGLKAQLQQLNIPVANVENGTILQRIALRSPIEGYVQKVNCKTGQYVEPQTNLFEVVNTHHVHADLMVFEKDVYKIKKGQKVKFKVQSIPNEELTASIYSVGKTFEQNPKALHVHAEIENKKGHLIPGMYIQGQVLTDSLLLEALPESAIGKEGDKSYIFTVEKEGENWSFKPVEVFTKLTSDNWVAIEFLQPVKPNTKFAMNNAYYLLAEWKKGEAEHSH